MSFEELFENINEIGGPKVDRLQRQRLQREAEEDDALLPGEAFDELMVRDVVAELNTQKTSGIIRPQRMKQIQLWWEENPNGLLRIVKDHLSKSYEYEHEKPISDRMLYLYVARFLANARIDIDKHGPKTYDI